MAIFVLAISGLARGAEAPARVQFSRDVLPILSNNCYQCHGPDENARKAHLRLDLPDCLKAQAKSGLPVIAANKATESELIARITATEPSELMPPPKSNHKLTEAQKETLRRWIDQGARWGKHWAYETPERPSFPSLAKASRAKNGIDSFILSRLEKEGITPVGQANKETLIRRVTFDLTGVPPTLEEVSAFLSDDGPGAYAKVVDRLLASPRFGERMAMDWLDDARYADTNGYQNDFARTMWPWRDWVIHSYNGNQPFDRFVVEQLAGDLLPGSTLEQRIATGFNRNNRAVTEAGSIGEEWRVENAIDRVETTGTVFLGLTVGCARCHDHKFDPISQKDFYRFFAFFNSANDQGVYTEQRGNTGPVVAVPSPQDKQDLHQLEMSIAGKEKEIRNQESTLTRDQQHWEQQLPGKPDSPGTDWSFACPLNGDTHFTLLGGYRGHGEYGANKPLTWSTGPFGKALRLDGTNDSFLDAGPAVSLDRADRFSYGGWVKINGNGAVLSKMDDAKEFRGFDLLLLDGKVNVHLVHTWPGNSIKVETKEPLPRDAWTHLFVTYDGSSRASGITVYVNGRKAGLDVRENRLRDTIVTSEPLRLGKRSSGSALAGELADIRIYPRTLAPTEVEALVA